jgi:hypothetical protein
MKPWVQEFLLSQGDKTISRESLIEELASPVFCYRRLADFFDHNFAQSERLKALFGQTLSCLDQVSFLKLGSFRYLYFHYADHLGHAMALRPSLDPGQAFTLVIFSGLENLSDSCIVGTFAHEIAHLVLDHCDKPSSGLNLESEQAADEQVRGWGLGFELDKVREHLKKQNKR